MADKGLFTRLQRLFSSDVIIRNIGGDQLRVVDTDHIQTSGEFETNSLMDRFAGIYQNPASTSLYGQQFNLNYQYLRTYLYSDYDLMDTDAIVASALDIVADECTLKNDMGEVLQIKSADDDIQQILYNLFYDVLNIEFNLWAWTRQMCKYGDFFLKLEISEKFGVYNVIPYSAYHIERQENFDPEHPSKVIFNYNPEGIYGGSSSGYYTSPNQPAAANTIQFDNYEIAHFRLVSDVNYLPYGRSYIEPGRKLFKQYSLMEDAMLIHRIVRAPEKRIFYINVGSIPPNEVENFMQKTISTMKRTPLMDEKTGEYNLKYNMQNIMEDFYIPVRGNDQATKIDTTKGLDYAGIEDVEYLREKLFAALKVPKAFMGYDENLSGKATLARQFRNNQIETEGNDPVTTGRSYGTPHDLASLYGTGRVDSDPANVPDGYNEKLPLGRPEEKASNINTQDNVFGKDRLGKKAMKIDDQPGLNEGANKQYLKNRSLLESMQKELVFTSDKKKESLLDESNIKE